MKRKLIALLVAATTLLSLMGCTEVEAKETRKANGVFFETNNGQIIITGDSQIWNVEDMDLKNGNKVRVKFDTKGTEDKTDDEIINVKRQYIPQYGSMYNLAERLSDGEHYILDLYKVDSVEFPTENVIQYNFNDGTELIALYE